AGGRLPVPLLGSEAPWVHDSVLPSAAPCFPRTLTERLPRCPRPALSCRWLSRSAPGLDPVRGRAAADILYRVVAGALAALTAGKALVCLQYPFAITRGCRGTRNRTEVAPYIDCRSPIDIKGG